MTNTYSYHNPEISSPLIERLLNALGKEWKNTTYGNDSLASIGKETLEGEWISVYIPNAVKCDPMQEEYSVFTVNLMDQYYVDFNTIPEVIAALSGNGCSELYDRLDEEHSACARSYDRIEAFERVDAALKTKKIKQKLTINFACDLSEFVQSYLIELYAVNGIKMKTMSNDEFAAEYGNILNTSELLLIESLGKFWESEVESIFT